MVNLSPYTNFRSKSGCGTPLEGDWMTATTFGRVELCPPCVATLCKHQQSLLIRQCNKVRYNGLTTVPSSVILSGHATSSMDCFG
jgi:hypothetical protein